MPRLLPPTQQEFATRFRRGDVAFPPLTLAWEEPKTKEIDGVVRMSWQGKKFRFAAEFKQLSNAKTIVTAAKQARRQAEAVKLLPLVVVPFLDEQSLATLESVAVSGIDLCGNGLVIVPGNWWIRRTGEPNLFRAEGAIKNVYRKSSSIVARLFLTQPEFDSVQDALEELGRRDGRIALSTVSKVCKRLEEDLIIERTRKGMTKLRLIQAEKLLDQLADNYSPPRVEKRLMGKLKGIESSEFQSRLSTWAKETGNLVSLTGTSSVTAYAIMAREGLEEYYCTDITGALRSFGDRFQPTERFASVSLLETPNEEVYFDRRKTLFASPVQSYLELARGDKRDQETASDVRRVILSGLTRASTR